MLKPIPLPVQVDMIFRDLVGELCGLTAGTVFIHIRNRTVSTFGVRHCMENRVEVSEWEGSIRKFVREEQVDLFREMATDLIRRHKNWCRGTVSYRFRMSLNTLMISAGFEDKEHEALEE